MGALEPSDILVELYYGQLDDDGQLTSGCALEMGMVGQENDHRVRYSVNMPCMRSGMTGYTVRILPRHRALISGRELGMIKWA